MIDIDTHTLYKKGTVECEQGKCEERLKSSKYLRNYYLGVSNASRERGE